MRGMATVVSGKRAAQGSERDAVVYTVITRAQQLSYRPVLYRIVPYRMPRRPSLCRPRPCRTATMAWRIMVSCVTHEGAGSQSAGRQDIAIE